MEKNPHIVGENNNKYTVGKYLRNSKGLRKEDKKSKIITPDIKLQNYIDFLVKKGLQFSKVAIAEFQTQNGLPYTGLVAKEKLLSNEVFITLPTECLLTTKKCHFSDIHLVFFENPQFFQKEYNHSWEDNTFWAFLLYENQKGEDSEWYHLLQNLSKDIDYLIHWNERDLALLEDDDLVRQARLALEEYKDDYQELKEILAKYPNYFKKDSFSEDKARWIYTHLVSRCFGNYFQYVTMVPFAEFLNHECTDVYYDFKYEEENPQKKEESEYPDPKELTQDDLDNADTSDGSYNSDLQERDEDFEFQLPEKPQFEILSQEQKKINPSTKKEIEGIANQIENWIYCNLDLGDQFSIFYAAQVYDRSKELAQEFFQEKMSYTDVKCELQNIQFQNTNFRLEVFKFYRNDLKYKKLQISLTQKQGSKESPRRTGRKIERKKNSSNMIPQSNISSLNRSGKTTNSTILLSNRMLLMRYGISLPYNKYDHVHIRLEYTEFLKDFVVVNKKLNTWKRIAKAKYIKVKRTTLCISMLFYLRAIQLCKSKEIVAYDYFFPNDLDFEVKVLKQMKDILENFMRQNFTKTLAQNEDLQKDKKIGYHEYFATVYKVERQRIIEKQIELVNVLIEMFNKVLANDKTSFQFARNQPFLNAEKESDVKMNRNMLKFYLDRIKLK